MRRIAVIVALSVIMVTSAEARRADDFILHQCGDKRCDGDETCTTCVKDCGACPAVCGDGICDPREDCSGCAQDCGACAALFCQGGGCDPSIGETCFSCESDCGACAALTPSSSASIKRQSSSSSHATARSSQSSSEDNSSAVTWDDFPRLHVVVEWISAAALWIGNILAIIGNFLWGIAESLIR
jgi:hypothetical protein